MNNYCSNNCEGCTACYKIHMLGDKKIHTKTHSKLNGKVCREDWEYTNEEFEALYSFIEKIRDDKKTLPETTYHEIEYMNYILNIAWHEYTVGHYSPLTFKKLLSVLSYKEQLAIHFGIGDNKGEINL